MTLSVFLLLSLLVGGAAFIQGAVGTELKPRPQAVAGEIVEVIRPS
mgnify:CR=1 FL=1